MKVEGIHPIWFIFLLVNTVLALAGTTLLYDSFTNKTFFIYFQYTIFILNIVFMVYYFAIKYVFPDEKKWKQEHLLKMIYSIGMQTVHNSDEGLNRIRSLLNKYYGGKNDKEKNK